MVGQASLQACSFLLARLSDEVARLNSITYPGQHHGPKKWLRFITGVLDTAETYLARASVDPSAPTAAKALNDAEDFGDTAYKLLNHISGADARDIPHQVVAPFQRWATSLGITDTLFFRAEHLPNYELSTWDVRSWATTVDDPSPTLTSVIKKEINWPIRRVTVPSHAMGMLPHFAVVAHELGHAIQDKIACDLTPHKTLENTVIGRIDARLKAHGKVKDAQVDQRILEIWLNWLNEIKADAVGLLVAGPSFFFALFAYLEVAGRQYGISVTHPPSDLRRRLLFRKLCEGGPSFRDVLRDDAGLTLEEKANSPNVPDCPASDILFNELNGGAQELVDAAIEVELVAFAEAASDTVFDAAKAFLTANCPSLLYTPAELRTDIAEFIGPLCALIPPIERRDQNQKMQATSLATILNVGWTTLLSKLDEIPVATTAGANLTAKKMERLHELLLKAVELSESRRVWEETK